MINKFKIVLYNNHAIRLYGYAFETISTSGFALLILLFATRSATLQEFGQFALVISIVGAQAPLAALGLNTLAYGRAGTRPRANRRLIGSAIAINFISGAALYSVTLYAFFLYSSKALTLLYAGAGLRLFGAAGMAVTNDAMARHAQAEYLPARLAVIAFAAMAASVAFYGEYPTFILALIWGAESAVFAAFLIWLNLGARAKLNGRNRYLPFLVKAAPIAIQSFFVVIYLRFDQIYVSWRFGNEATGLYAAAARIAEVGGLGLNILTLVVSPAIINQITKNDHLSKRSVLFLISIALFAMFASFIGLFFGAPILKFIFGPLYAEADTVLAIYVASIPFVAFGSIGSRVLAAQGVSGPQAWSGLSGALSNVALSILLSEIMGLEGVALATVISYALASGILWNAVFRRRRDPYTLR